MRVGRNIRAIRKQRGLTLDELSALCGVNRDDLGAYERGERTPRPATVEKIAAALEAPIVDIRGGMGWTAPQAVEEWELQEENAPLRAGILEALREACGERAGAPALGEDEVRTLMESVKASIPALVERMKDTRPEPVIHREILTQLDRKPADEASDRYELTDEQWAQLRDLLPPEKAGKGRAFKSNRLMLDGILYWMKSGVAWKDLPQRFGRYQCVSGRLRLWSRMGVWEPVVRRLQALNILEGDAAADQVPPDATEK